MNAQSTTISFQATFYSYAGTFTAPTDKVYLINNDQVTHSLTAVVLDPASDCTFTYVATSAVPASLMSFDGATRKFTIRSNTDGDKGLYPMSVEAECTSGSEPMLIG